MHVEIHPLLGRQGSAPPPGAARHKKIMRGGRCNKAPAPSLHGEGLIDAGEESEERPQVEGEEAGMREEELWEWERHGGEGGKRGRRRGCWRIRKNEEKKWKESKKRMRVRRGG